MQNFNCFLIEKNFESKALSINFDHTAILNLDPVFIKVRLELKPITW